MCIDWWGSTARVLNPSWSVRHGSRINVRMAADRLSKVDSSQREPLDHKHAAFCIEPVLHACCALRQMDWDFDVDLYTPIKQSKKDVSQTPEKIEEKEKAKTQTPEAARRAHVLWGRMKEHWQSKLPMAPKSICPDTSAIHLSKRAWAKQSWLTMLDDSTGVTFACVACAETSREYRTSEPSLFNLMRHHKSEAHAKSCKVFLGLQVGPSGTACSAHRVRCECVQHAPRARW